jgi:hypothetical protein
MRKPHVFSIISKKELFYEKNLLTAFGDNMTTIKFRKPFVRSNKYSAKKVVVDGITFDSKAEAEFYGQLKLRKYAKDIRFFLRQVPFDLPGGIKYRADFMIKNNDGSIEFIDVKGIRTPTYIIKKKQVEQIYGIEIMERS